MQELNFQMFYVYLLYRNSDPLWRYVGKGQVYSYCCDPDARVKQSVKRCKADWYRIVFKTTCEEEALWMEHRVWRGLKDRGFTLANKRRPNLHNFSLSEETKAKISAANKGKVRSPELRVQISATLTGRKHTEEFREKIRQREFTWGHKISKTRRLSPHIAKLNPEKVQKIRQLVSSGTSRKEIAELFNISLTMVDHIKYRRTWSDVPEQLITI